MPFRRRSGPVHPAVAGDMVRSPLRRAGRASQLTATESDDLRLKPARSSPLRISKFGKAESGRLAPGRFPYGSRGDCAGTAVGCVRKPSARELSASPWRDGEREVHLLSGHSYDRPLATKRGGTLKLEDRDRCPDLRGDASRGGAAAKLDERHHSGSTGRTRRPASAPASASRGIGGTQWPRG